VRNVLAFIGFVLAIAVVGCGGQPSGPKSDPISITPQEAKGNSNPAKLPTEGQNAERAKETPAPSTTPAHVPSPSPSPNASPIPTPTPTGDIVFVRDGNLWLGYVRDGRQVPLTMDGNNSSPKWSVDGRWVLFVHSKGSGSELQVIGADGSGRHQLVGGGSPYSGALYSDPIWSPKGDAILFTATRDTNKDGKLDERDVSEVWLVSADGSNLRKLAEGRDPAWSPEGLRVAFATLGKLDNEVPYRRDNGIDVINREGKNEWTLVSTSRVPGEITLGGYKFGSGVFLIDKPAWSPTSKLVSLTAIGHTGMVLTITDKASDLRPWGMNYEGGFGRSVWSPHGELLAYESYPPSGVSEIVVGSPDVPRLVAIGGVRTGLSVNSPTWSPDGKYLAFVQESGTRFIGVVGADGQGLRQLATGNVSEPDWSPKGATGGN